MFAEYLDGLQEIAEATYEDEFTAYSYEWAKVGGLDRQIWVERDVTLGKVAGRSIRGDTTIQVVTLGGVERLVERGGIHLSVDADLPEVEWEYVLTWLGPHSDPALLGRRWRVVNVPAKSYATGRRLDVVLLDQEG